MGRRHRSIKKRIQYLENQLGGSPGDGDLVGPEDLEGDQRIFLEAFLEAFEEASEADKDRIDEVLDLHERSGDREAYPSEAHRLAYDALLARINELWDEVEVRLSFDT